MKPSLAELQTWMARVVSHPEGVARALAAQPDSPCAAVVHEDRGLSRAERLDIYGMGYFQRLEECLTGDFEAVRHVIGVEAYGDLLREYLVACPSRSISVMDLGDRFAGFLETHAFAKRFPFLPELARLEWLALESHFSEERAWPEFPSLQGWGESELERAVLQLDPSVRLHSSAWPLTELWHGQDSAEPAAVPAQPQREFQLVFRAQHVIVEAVTATEAQVLEALQAGETLGGLLAGLGEVGDFDFQASFARWRAWGVVQGITLLRKNNENSGRFWS